jgi:hypothetical protein
MGFLLSLCFPLLTTSLDSTVLGHEPGSAPVFISIEW